MISMMKKAVITGAASAAAIGLGVGPAAAATTVAGGPSFNAYSTNWTFALGSVSIQCVVAATSGVALPGVHTLPSTVIDLTSMTFSGCATTTTPSRPATVTTTVSTSNPWPLVVSAMTATGATGTLTTVGATISIPTLGCTILVTGSAPVAWDNSQVLSFTGGSGLATSSSGFCIGFGSTASFTGNFAVVASPSPITIS